MDQRPGKRCCVYSNPARSFHPKATWFELADGSGRASIGSANLSRSGLPEGVEWTWAVLDIDCGDPMNQLARAFDSLFTDSHTLPVTPDWIDRYVLQRRSRPCESRHELTPALEPFRFSADASGGCLVDGPGAMDSARPQKSPHLAGLFVPFLFEMAGELGFEPRLTESESVVLPLDDSPVVPRRWNGRQNSPIRSLSPSCRAFWSARDRTASAVRRWLNACCTADVCAPCGGRPSYVRLRAHRGSRSRRHAWWDAGFRRTPSARG